MAKSKLLWEWSKKINHISDIRNEHLYAAYGLDSAVCTGGNCRRNCRKNPFCLRGLGQRRWDDYIAKQQAKVDDRIALHVRHEGLPGGLRNLGATCYVNSYLQISGRPYTVGVSPKEVWSKPDEYLVNDGVEMMISQSMQTVFGELEAGKEAAVDTSNLIVALGLNSGEQQDSRFNSVSYGRNCITILGLKFWNSIDDAQEFSKLFLALLEREFYRCSDPFVRSIIPDLFQGRYEYKTKCSVCDNESRQPSTFYELDLQCQAKMSLNECIDAFLMPEILEGDNQYFCTGCQMKRDATRSVVLSRLPPVLSFQLLRFVFDRETGRKKKLSHVITFPHTLDMSTKVTLERGQDRRQCLYELTSVLVHYGSSANSGHYCAIIHSKDANCWYHFNDETVEILNGPILNTHLEKQQQQQGEKKPKKPRLDADEDGSHGAYMLVYELKDRLSSVQSRECAVSTLGCDDALRSCGLDDTVTSCESRASSVERCAPRTNGRTQSPSPRRASPQKHRDNNEQVYSANDAHIALTLGTMSNGSADPIEHMPKDLQQIIRDKNAVIEEQLRVKQALQEEQAKVCDLVQREMLEPLKQLELEADRMEFCFVPKCWLMMWLGEGSVRKNGQLTHLPPIDLRPYMCSHGKLHFRHVPLLKAVSVTFGTDICTRYGCFPTPLLGRNALCRDCVWTECGVQKSLERVAVDIKFLQAALKKAKADSKHTIEIADDGYWIGTKSLKCWAVLARNRLTAKCCTLNESITPEPPDSPTPCANENDSEPPSVPSTSSASTTPRSLDLTVCPANMSSDGTCTLLISADGHEEMASMGSAADAECKAGPSCDGLVAQDVLPFLNADLLCRHKKLCADESLRRLVPPVVWHRIASYFTDENDFPTFSNRTDACAICVMELIEMNHKCEKAKEKSAREKSLLPALANERKRPNLKGKANDGVDCLYVVCREFIKQWQLYLRDPRKYQKPERMCNRCFLCDHGKLPFVLEDLEDKLMSIPKCVLVSSNEWEVLTATLSYDYDKCIRIFRCAEQNSNDALLSDPEVCADCYQLGLHVGLDMSRKIRLFFRRIDDCVSTEPNGSIVNGFTPNDLLGGETTQHPARRSTRQTRRPNTPSIDCEPHDTVLHVKLQLMQSPLAEGVTPNDMHLEYNGVELPSDDTLAQLGVPSGALLTVRVDVTLPDAEEKPTKREQGFKGTLLHS